ncbi:MAG TPA: TIGR04255 family protein [Candidatus Saccharimonadales bacterium]|nr:TIGR04255 family protein [Candidatus Saccharimonadales bacterium]
MFGLEAAPPYRLTRPPLVHATAEVRFPVRAKLPTLDGIAPIQERLAPVFPYMNQQQTQQVSLLVSPSGPSAAQTQSTQTWRFTDDGGWTLVVSSDTANLAVGPQYVNFAEFADRFRVVLAALADGAGVQRADRLGVRYVNVAEVPPGDAEAWRHWFRPELTGWTATEVVGESTRVTTSITQTQLAAPPIGELSGPPVEIQAIVRHGLIPALTIVPGVVSTQPKNPAYLLDIDLFVEAAQPFDADELSRQVTMLHNQIDRFFFWAIAPKGAAYFGRELLS